MNLWHLLHSTLTSIFFHLSTISSISDEDREIIKSHFKEMKQEHASLSDEEKDAKHAEFKSKMEEFSALSLDEKIVHLQELANSLR